MAKKRYSKIYKLKNSSDERNLGYYHNPDLDGDSDRGFIISQQIFEFNGELFILCLIEIDEQSE